MKHKNDIREFAKYSSLNVLGMLGLSCYILADTYFVAKGLGANGLAALNLAIPIYSFVHGTGLMLGMGGATRYSIAKGQKEEKSVTNQIYSHTVRLAVLISFVFVLLGLFQSKQLTELLLADLEVFQMTNTYLKVILLFAPAFIMNDVLICFVRNDGNPRLAMLAMLGGSLSNVVLDYLFIFPFHMGIFGAVLATGLAPIISMLILSRHLIKKNKGFTLIKGNLNRRTTFLTFSLGFPSLITEVSSGIVIIVFNVLILSLLGNIGVAAYGVIANISLVVLAIYTGIAQGIQPLISKAYGHKDKSTIKRTVCYALVTVGILSCFIYILLFFYATPIVSIFNSEQHSQLQSIAELGLKIYFTSVVFVGFNIILSMFFTSIDKPIPAHIISMLRGLLIIIPMAFLLSTVAGVMGVWLTFPITEGVVALLSGVLFLRIQSRKR